MIKKKNIIIIGSAGRNNGKTKYACELINQLSKHYLVFGVKVTTIKKDGEKCPRGEQSCGICGTLSEPYKISEERDNGTQKDTEKMLRSGAKKVLWLRVFKKSLIKRYN